MTKPSLISILLLSSALAACGTSPQKATVEAPVPVLATDVGGSSGGRALSIGLVRGTNSHELAAEHGGRVVALYANVGDRVRQGQVLAKLDPTAFRMAVDQARASLNQASAAYGEAESVASRINGLADAGIASKAERDAAASTAAQARQQVAAAEAQYRLALRNLSLTTIVAPASGVIGARYASLSALVSPGGVLFSIDGEGDLEIEARIPGAIADTIRPGDTFGFRFGSLEGRAKLVGFSRRADGVDVRQARFTIIDGTPASGVAVELMLPTKRPGAETTSTIPMSAIIPDRVRGGHRVLVIAANGKLQSVPIEIVEVTSLGAEVRGALAGRKIVAAGATNLSIDRRVRPVPYTF